MHEIKREKLPARGARCCSSFFPVTSFTHPGGTMAQFPSAIEINVNIARKR